MLTNVSINFIVQHDSDAIPWRCERCKSIIGYVVVEDKVPRLDMVQQRGMKITGDADIHCLTCGTIREWHYNEEALNRLVNRVIERRKKYL